MHCAMMTANNGTCYRRIPLEGTSCGNGKVCEKGYCVESPSGATNLTETCLFGDQPQTVRNQNVSSADLIAADKSNCYNYGEECCETCGVIAESYTNFTDCAYGDRSDCGTFPGAYCYVSENNLHVCCALCKNAETGIAGCEYGDKADWCGDPSLCALNSEVCCYNCRETTTSSNTTTATTTPTITTTTPTDTATAPTTSTTTPNATTTTPSTTTTTPTNTATTSTASTANPTATTTTPSNTTTTPTNTAATPSSTVTTSTATIPTTTSSKAGTKTIDWTSYYLLLTALALFATAPCR